MGLPCAERPECPNDGRLKRMVNDTAVSSPLLSACGYGTSSPGSPTSCSFCSSWCCPPTSACPLPRRIWLARPAPRSVIRSYCSTFRWLGSSSLLLPVSLVPLHRRQSVVLRPLRPAGSVSGTTTFRWVECSLSSSVMIVLIAQIVGISGLRGVAGGCSGSTRR